MAGELWQHYCEVQAGEIKAVAEGNEDDLDIEVSVGFSKSDDSLSFEATIWNLKKGTWAGVSRGDTCKIVLGWADTGPSPQSVCLGVIAEKYTDTKGSDRKYIIKGKDKSQARLENKQSANYRDQTPDSIARSIGSLVGLGHGKFDSVGEPIEGIYSIKKTQPVKYWLDELKEEAGKKTGKKWEYYAKAGKLYFIKKKTKVEEAVDIDRDNAFTVERSTGQTEKTSGGPEVDFEAYLDPRLTKDSLVNIDSVDFSGAYRVSSYDFTSSTVDEEHKMSGTAAPIGSQYEEVYPGAPRGAVRAYKSSRG